MDGRMIKKVLIANRGEIALRVIKTCKSKSIKTVTIYAADDATLPHASAGDENISLGRGALSDTYLNQDKIINIAKETGADAIHPGYGFLSENTEFCKKVSEAGLIFIGPSVEAIELMGDKKESKVKMEALGIPLVPGYHGDNQEPNFLFDEAKKIGFPVLIKATAGGGGKGMRIVNSESEFTDALNASKREALNAFSNDKVLLEKYIINPRHIEVQLVSDGQGNHFHFYERECSIQRRYQKVIEETPSPALDEKLRTAICETAVKIAKGINYIGAGTIEYILAPNNEYYFLEMNTRLQVEHPVTEMVTGRDLVELQILAAEGKAFTFKQEDITQTGHSIECRIYAEDPDNEFLPTTGRIQKIHINPEIDFRLDCGYKDGNNISTSYDPMLAKLITYDMDRYAAIEKMQISLNNVLFGGTKTNRDYLKRVLANEKFEIGDIHTHLIEQDKSDLVKKGFSDNQLAHFMAISLAAKTNEYQNVWDQSFNTLSKKLKIDESEYEIQLTRLNRKQVEFYFNDKLYQYEILYWEKGHIVVGFEGEAFSGHLFTLDVSDRKQVFINEWEAQVEVMAKVKRATASDFISEGALQSPMPGKVFKVLKKVGDKVKKGDSVLIVEAMKMEHTIKATTEGLIKEIFFNEGDQVQGGVLLCEIE